MPTVRMLRTRTGSPDGVSVVTYRAGDCPELDDSLASVFLEDGSAEPVEMVPGDRSSGFEPYPQPKVERDEPATPKRRRAAPRKRKTVPPKA